MPVTARSACLLELARIVDLEVDTDDKSGPSCKRVLNFGRHCDTRSTNDNDLKGVAVFLILSVAEEVCAIICGSLPVVIPQLFREFKRGRPSQQVGHSYTAKRLCFSHGARSESFKDLMKVRSFRYARVRIWSAKKPTGVATQSQQILSRASMR